MEIKAFAKLNLCLHMIGKREDGYHLLDSVMQSVDICDELSLEKKQGEGVWLTCKGDKLLYNEENLAVRAAKAYLRHCGIHDGIQIQLQKNIPIGAGMGGGSADAAAVLYGLQEIYNQKMEHNELVRLALTLGADVPFCLVGGCQRAQGIGEQLSQVRPAKGLWWVILHPGEGLSTARVYAEYDRLYSIEDERGIRDEALKRWQTGDYLSFFQLTRNDLEAPAMALYPPIGQMKEALERAGAEYVRMSGSGTAVFGVFTEQMAARQAKQQLEDRYPFVQLACSVDG